MIDTAITNCYSATMVTRAQLKSGLVKLINKHHSAVQADTELEFRDISNKHARRKWDDYDAERKLFDALLDEVPLGEGQPE